MTNKRKYQNEVSSEFLVPVCQLQYL